MGSLQALIVGKGRGEIMGIRRCSNCKHNGIDKGRDVDGRRAYRCQACGSIWTEGLQGVKQSYSDQRQGFQFSDTGAYKQEDIEP